MASEMVPAPKPQVNLRSIWGGEEQTYLSYDGIELTYSIKVLEAILGSGYADAPTAEKAAFLAYCKANQLDPIRGQVYFVKYGASDPAGFVTNWEVFLDRAQRHPQYDGYSCGIVWLVGTEKRNKIIRGRPCEYRQDGTHRVIGGWATVNRKDRKIPRDVEVPLEEMMALKRDGSPTKFWRTMLTTMATKTPTARGHRQCFPDVLGGLYTDGETEVLRPARELAVEPGTTLPPKDLDEVAALLKDGTIDGDPGGTYAAAAKAADVLEGRLDKLSEALNDREPNASEQAEQEESNGDE